MVVTRNVKPECVPAFEGWLREYARAAERRPGHLGLEVLRPGGTAGPYTVVANWDSSAHLQAWLQSDEHTAWIARAAPLLATAEQRDVRTGLETWFTPPGAPASAAPPRWKMFLVTWAVVWVVVWILDIWYAPLIAPLPVALRALLFTLVIVGLLTYVLMPRATRLLHRFLFG